jgi:predicted transposase YbfD/YdcC
MGKYEEALNIVSAQIAELGITFAQQSVFAKSNEIPAVRELLGTLKIPGCVVVADALHCQKETAEAVIEGKADYLLSVKDNQKALKADIEDYVQDGVLRKSMDTFETVEKNRGRLEKRRAFTTGDIGWLYGKEEWKGLSCIGAVHLKTSGKKGNTDEWHYYISSRGLTAEELLRRARLEWSVETMHWLLDVHFREDFCRVDDKNVQENMNGLHKNLCVKGKIS